MASQRPWTCPKNNITLITTGFMKRDNQGNGGSLRITYEHCLLAYDHFHWGRTEVILSMVL